MRCKRKHFTAQSEEFNAVFVVPSYHFNNVLGVCKSQALDVPLSSGNITGLIEVRSIFGGVVWSIWVFEGVPLFEYRGNPAGSRAEHWRI